MTTNMPYKGQHTAKLLSPSVWGRFPVKQASCMIGGEFRIAAFRDARSTAIATPDATVTSGDIRVADTSAADIDIKRSLDSGTPVLDWTPTMVRIWLLVRRSSSICQRDDRGHSSAGYPMPTLRPTPFSLALPA